MHTGDNHLRTPRCVPLICVDRKAVMGSSTSGATPMLIWDVATRANEEVAAAVEVVDAVSSMLVLWI